VSLLRDFKNGLWNEHPIFRLLLGMCPLLAVTTTAVYGLAMGLATLFVVVCAEIVISLIRNLIPKKVRIPSFIIIIATFVTIVDYTMAAFLPDIAEALSIFIPLIVTNCLIMARVEAFASKVPVKRAIADALGQGVGFTWGLVLLAAVRELLGQGAIFGVQVLGEGFPTWGIMGLPAGAFISLGIILAVINQIIRFKHNRTKEVS